MRRLSVPIRDRTVTDAPTRSYATLDGLAVAGKRVLVRVDLNVPMPDGRVGDRTRIECIAATLTELAAAGARVVLLSHFGRPKGKPVPAMSLAPLARPLSDALGGQAVAFVADCVGERAQAAVADLADGDVLLLENLRFHAGEEANDPEFAAALAALGEVYVNDAFSAAHRAHASVVGLAERLPHAAGRLMQAELDTLSQALDSPERPLAAVVGGAKISTKLDLLNNLVAKVDHMIIGGGMANTLLAAGGVEVGKSLCEHDLAESARAIIANARTHDCTVLLPVDAVIAHEFRHGAPFDTVRIDLVPDDAMILDLGPITIQGISRRLQQVRTLVWNGPLGAFEVPPYDRATVAVAQEVAALTQAGQMLSVGGGGDTVAALAHADAVDGFSYVSTAGGAFLEWLEGKTLPGVAALQR